MISRTTSTPCLGERVSALADGSLRDDVRDRALAHTLTCPACRDALDVERLTIERLRSLPQPQPSAGLMAALYALGEPGGPVPPRFGPGPGMPRPTPVPLVPPTYPPRSGAPGGASGSGPAVRPGGSRRPAGAGTRARRTRTFVAAAGALGMGFVAAGVLTAGAASSSGTTTRTPVAQLTVQPPARQQPGAGLVGGTVLTAGFAPAMPATPLVGGWGAAADRFDAPTTRGVVAHQAVVALAGH
ncbi:MAG: hypothetical protein ACTHN8_12025 [Angustibacter sp.]